MQSTKNYEAGRADIQDNAMDVRAKDCAAAEGDASPKAPDAVAVAIGLMEEYAEVFEELAK